MKTGAVCFLHTMPRPWATALLETDVIRRMPVTREVDGDPRIPRLVNPAIHDRDNLVSASNGKSAAGTKIVLDVRNEQRVTRYQRSFRGHVFTVLQFPVCCRGGPGNA